MKTTESTNRNVSEVDGFRKMAFCII